MVSQEYRKDYYQKHKEHILATMNRTKHCNVCNKNIRFCSWNKHCRSKKHLNLKAEAIQPNKDIEQMKEQLLLLQQQIQDLKKNL